jgi:hypothetical protein
MGAQEVAEKPNDLEQLKRRFEEFQSLRTSRGRLPQALWKEAAEAAKRYGLNPTESSPFNFLNGAPGSALVRDKPLAIWGIGLAHERHSLMDARLTHTLIHQLDRSIAAVEFS